MKKKSFIVLVLMLAALVALVGCSSGAEEGGGEAAAQEPVEVGYIQMNLTAAYYLEMQKGFEEAARRLNVDLDVLDSQGNLDKQIEHI
jgi:ABC-type sugar transport system substrate-binding protein